MLQPTELLVGAEMPTRDSGESLTLHPSLLGRLAKHLRQFRIVLGNTTGHIVKLPLLAHVGIWHTCIL